MLHIGSGPLVWQLWPPPSVFPHMASTEKFAVGDDNAPLPPQETSPGAEIPYVVRQGDTLYIPPGDHNLAHLWFRGHKTLREMMRHCLGTTFTHPSGVALTAASLALNGIALTAAPSPAGWVSFVTANATFLSRPSAYLTISLDATIATWSARPKAPLLYHVIIISAATVT